MSKDQVDMEQRWITFKACVRVCVLWDLGVHSLDHQHPQHLHWFHCPRPHKCPGCKSHLSKKKRPFWSNVSQKTQRINVCRPFFLNIFAVLDDIRNPCTDLVRFQDGPKSYSILVVYATCFIIALPFLGQHWPQKQSWSLSWRSKAAIDYCRQKISIPELQHVKLQSVTYVCVILCVLFCDSTSALFQALQDS